MNDDHVELRAVHSFAKLVISTEAKRWNTLYSKNMSSRTWCYSSSLPPKTSSPSSRSSSSSSPSPKSSSRLEPEGRVSDKTWCLKRNLEHLKSRPRKKKQNDPRTVLVIPRRLWSPPNRPGSNCARAPPYDIPTWSAARPYRPYRRPIRRPHLRYLRTRRRHRYRHRHRIRGTSRAQGFCEKECV